MVVFRTFLSVLVLVLGAMLPPGAADCPEASVTQLPLSDEVTGANAELSGLAWRGDHLVLLPQYPARFPSGADGSVLVLDRAAIEAAIDGSPRPLSPRRVPLVARDIERSIPGFEGFEAIAFDGDRVWATVESDQGEMTYGHLIAGRVVGVLDRIELDVAGAVTLAAQSEISNLGYEALTVVGGRVHVLYEVNGAANARPRVEVFDRDLRRLPSVRMQPLEYRLTDATAADAEGRFWVANYFYSGDCWETAACPLTARFGAGATHRTGRTVERLVELRATRRGVRITSTPPVLLALDGGEGRNWEGLARLGDRGFLLVTDEHPATELAFVAR